MCAWNSARTGTSLEEVANATQPGKEQGQFERPPIAGNRGTEPRRCPRLPGFTLGTDSRARPHLRSGRGGDGNLDPLLVQERSRLLRPWAAQRLDRFRPVHCGRELDRCDLDDHGAVRVTASGCLSLAPDTAGPVPVCTLLLQQPLSTNGWRPGTQILSKTPTPTPPTTSDVG